MNNRTLLLIISCLAYMAIGFHFSIRSGLAGDLAGVFSQADAAHSSEMVGSVLGVCFLGYAITMFIVSPLIDAIGMGLLMRLSGSFIVAGTVLAMAAERAPILGIYHAVWLGMLLVGIGWGLVDTNTNPLVVTMFPEDKTHKLNVIHAWWPGGIILGGLAGIVLGNMDASWQVKFLVGLLPSVLLVMLCFLVEFPLTERAASGIPFGDMFRELARRPMFWVWFACIWLTATCELAPGQWVEMALTRTVGMRGIWLLIYISGLMFVMRHFAGNLVHKLSPLGLLWISCLSAAIGLWWLGSADNPMQAFLAATLWGTGVCFMWPTMLALVSERFPRSGALGMGIMGTGATLAIYLFLPQMGKIFDAAKIKAAGGKEAFLALNGADLDRVLAIGAAESFRVTAFLPMILLLVFGVIGLYERKRKTRSIREYAAELTTTNSFSGD
jgi:MFS family permease